jgi:hypothetical protein
MLIASIPLTSNSAEAHVADFNMSYLYFEGTSAFIATQGNVGTVSPSYLVEPWGSGFYVSSIEAEMEKNK